ncbi:uncharacterized protein LOC115369602 [Myripristis murdjan]|uniref:uncharacterized protein LOC115369602 n=1 Tax=Myripristis murdjan TaxID=586833 RepID=UPI001175DFD8|nr:uncharacterized protein LOC115369602 [Myripristis murdjan]
MHLGCMFENLPLSSSSRPRSVLWLHNAKSRLVNVSSTGNIQFLDPRDGRVKAFPIQSSQGDYSIRIDELQESDLGCYRCVQGGRCLQVEVTEKGGLSEEMWLVIYAATALAIFILILGVCSYCCVKSSCCWDQSTPDYVNNVSHTAVVFPPPEETSRGTGSEQQRGAENNLLIYENDEHDPALHQNVQTRYHHDLSGIQPDPDRGQSPARMESQRKKQGFHRELFTRLRQASLSRHYYVNQVELTQQATSSRMENHHRASFWRKKAKTKHEYKNPIYNNSTDQLNRL